MADDQDIQDWHEALSKASKNAGLFGKAANTAAKATNDAAVNVGRSGSSLNNGLNAISGSVKLLRGSTDGLLNSFTGLITKLTGLEIFSDIVHGANALVNTYKEMTNIGQTFNGSMFDMLKQSGEAGLGLQDFTKLMARHSEASAVMAQTTNNAHMSLGQLNKSLLDNTRAQGFYGMTIDQMSDLSADYAETLREQGRLSRVSKQQTTDNLASFAKDISDFADVTGKSRTQIAHDTAEAMKDVSIISAGLSDRQLDVSNRAVAFMASMPGDAGKMFATMLSQTIGNGSAIFSDQMKTFTEAGGAEFLGVMDKIGARARSGQEMSPDDAVQNLRDMKQYYASNKEMLHVQAMAGNESAKSIIKQFNQLENINEEQYRQKMEDQKKQGDFTNTMMKLEEGLTSITAAFEKGLGDALKPLEKYFATGSDPFKKLKDLAEKYGTALGGFIVNFVDKFDKLGFSDGLETSFNKIIDGVISVTDMLIGLGSAINTGINTMTGFFASIGVGGKTIGALLAAFLLLKPVLGIVSMFSGLKSLFSKDVRINAANVNINGKGLGGALSGGLMGGSRKGGKGGIKGMLGDLLGFGVSEAVGEIGEHLTEHLTETKEAAAAVTPKAATTGAKVAEVAAEGAKVTGSVGKTALKAVGSIAKLVPRLGLVIGGMLAAQRAWQGDFVGAGMEVLGGVASMIPIIGTAADVAIQGAIITRDQIGADTFDKAVSGAVGSIFSVTPGTAKGGGRGSVHNKNTVPAAPATPNDENNPYKDWSDSDRNDKMADLTDKLQALNFAKLNPGDYDQSGRDMLQKETNDLLKQIAQINLIATKKAEEADKKLIRQGALAINAAAAGA